MSSVMLRPDLKTAGGEVHDILYQQRFVGTLSLVYRENDRVAGTLQLEQEVLPESAKDEVFDTVHLYVQAFVDAVRARECEIMVTYSSYDHVIVTESAAANLDLDLADELDYDLDWDSDDEIDLADPDIFDNGMMTTADFELVVVGESEDAIEYHIYDQNEDWVAEAILQIEDREVSGMVNWLIEPTEPELDVIADLLVLEFDDDQVDIFVIDMKFNDEIIETIELTHEDMLEDEDEADDIVWAEEYDINDYNIVLARDDGGVLTYEIYQQSRGGLPIGTATVDISQRQLTGFIDFREAGSSDDREAIAMMLMQELDKEKDYNLINLSMMHRNQLIEEVLFETEPFH
ncbi:hypothetical protein [Paenibacillus cremeus]|uniref:Uncharacterized protein n=1 Tax=Paenibacillus cremeus TaxID=2163881 RepID=A0A559K823_9BACL|nr:hypothetical protein [Paenibacillus cremeus]TVY08280.1 hypothetical protein FPZ49_19635 [Paenibacillus cremeus]